MGALLKFVLESSASVYLKVIGHGLDLQFYYGDEESNMNPIGLIQDLSIVSDEVAERFNGSVAGLYATSSGLKSPNKTNFKYFENKNLK